MREEDYKEVSKHHGFWPSTVTEKPGRASVLEFSDGLEPRIQSFSTPEELRTYMNGEKPAQSTRPSSSASSSCSVTSSSTVIEPVRRLIILEDLGEGFITVLGASLRIPPAFFDSHFTLPVKNREVEDELGEPHDRSRYWKIRLPQLHDIPAPLRKSIKGWELEKMNLKRRLTKLSDETESDSKPDWLLTFHNISFWAHEGDNGDWTAVLLVDPMVKKVVHPGLPSKPDITLTHQTVPTTPCASMAPLPTAPTPIRALKKHPPTILSAGLSHHDTLLHLYTRPFPHATTVPCRTLIRRAWTTYITAQEKLHNSWFHADNYAHLSPAATCPHWSRRAYQKAVYQRFDLSGAALPLFVSAAESVGAALEGGAAAEGVGTREVEAWRDVRRRFARLDERLGNALASYGERAAVEEALAAKEGARSVGRVTVVATVFVPCTLVWALFSIGGRYAVGEEEHWVPWVVMVSVQMVVLLVWLWFNRYSVKAKVSVRMAKGKKKTKEVIRLTRMRQRDEEMGLL